MSISVDEILRFKIKMIRRLYCIDFVCVLQFTENLLNFL